MALEPFIAFLADAAAALAAGWGARGRRRERLLAATRHAVDFHTWRPLVRDGGLDAADAVDLVAAMVRHSLGGRRPRAPGRPWRETPEDDSPEEAREAPDGSRPAARARG